MARRRTLHEFIMREAAVCGRMKPRPMKEAALDEKLSSLHKAWDEMDAATQRILVSQPDQMTAVAERLERARLAMREAVMALAR